MTNYGKEIERLYDEYGPIQVFDDGHKRVLMFGENDEQGSVLKQAPALIQYSYVRAMLLVLLFEPEVEDCLLLGLGTGALANALLAQLPQANIQAVELRREVIKLAHSHFMLPRVPQLKVKCADAGRFVARHSQRRYQLIFSDLYLSDGMDPQQAEIEFVDNCMANLGNDGWLVFNYWVTHKQAASIAYIKDLFEQVWVNNIDGENWIVFASNAPSTLAPDSINSKAKMLAAELGFPLREEALGLMRVV